MAKQQGNPKRSVALAAVFMVVAVGAFAAAFYYLDGMSVIDSLFNGEPVTNANASDSTSGDSTSTQSANPATSGADDTELRLPPGMSEEFALRIWQEQIDSQVNIAKLIDGEIERLVIDSVEQDGDVATLAVSAEFTDGTSAPGELGMRLFGGNWYAAYITGLRGAQTGGSADSVSPGDSGPSDTDLPSLGDVDVPLLNEMLAQQASSAAVLEEYATGQVEAVRILDVVEGAGTYVLEIEMDETHETGRGKIVLISRVLDSGRHWFFAKFTKTQEDS